MANLQLPMGDEKKKITSRLSNGSVEIRHLSTQIDAGQLPPTSPINTRLTAAVSSAVRLSGNARHQIVSKHRVSEPVNDFQ